MVNWIVGAGARMVQKGAACHYICMKRPLLIRVPARSPPWLMHAGVMCKQNHAKRSAGARRQADMGPLAGWKVAGLGNMARAGRVAQRAAAYHASGRDYPIATEGVPGRTQAPLEEALQQRGGYPWGVQRPKCTCWR